MKTIFIVLAFIISLNLFSCKTQNNKTVIATNDSLLPKIDTLKSKSAIDEKPSFHLLGDTINLGFQSIAILKCEDDFKGKDVWNVPASKLKTVFIKIMYINNTSDSGIRIIPSKWILVDVSGVHYRSIGLVSAKYPKLPSKKLLPKEQTIGWLAFKTPYFQSDFEAILQSDIEDENVVAIRIGIPGGLRPSHI